YALLAAAFRLASDTSVAFNITPGPASQVVFTVQPSSSTAGATITPAVQITARDAQGNTATTFIGNVIVALGTNPGGGTLAGTTTVAAVSGVATFGNLSINKAASGYTLVASSLPLAGATSSAFNVTAAAAASVALNAGNAQTAAVGTAVPIPPSVIVRDQFSNPVAGMAGIFAVASGGGTVSPTTAVLTNASGIAGATSWTLGTKIGRASCRERAEARDGGGVAHAGSENR